MAMTLLALVALLPNSVNGEVSGCWWFISVKSAAPFEGPMYMVQCGNCVTSPLRNQKCLFVCHVNPLNNTLASIGTKKRENWFHKWVVSKKPCNTWLLFTFRICLQHIHKIRLVAFGMIFSVFSQSMSLRNAKRRESGDNIRATKTISYSLSQAFWKKKILTDDQEMRIEFTYILYMYVYTLEIICQSDIGRVAGD